MFGGRMVWVGMSRGRSVGGRNVKVPVPFLIVLYNMYAHILF